MAKRPTYKMISFARNVIAGTMTDSEALKNSEYNTEGMTAQSIANMASQLLKHPAIAEAIQKAKEETLRGGRLVREDVVAILENIAEARLGDFITFESRVLFDPMTGTTKRMMVLDTKDGSELTVDQLACIQEISETNTGKVRVKLKSATDAIKELNRMQGWFAAPKAPVGKDGEPAPAMAVLMNAEEYKEARAKMIADDDC